MVSASAAASDGAPTNPAGRQGDDQDARQRALEARLEVRFRTPALLRTALTHPSYANEHPGGADGATTDESNERLEFLGDAVLGLIVAEALYTRYPELEEGRLTEWRAQIVCGPTLARASERYGIGDALLLGRGEEATGGRTREGNLERVFEATVGALLLDQGLEVAREFAERALAVEFRALEGDDPAALNPKGALQQLAQGVLGRPHYVTTLEEGPEHSRRFTVEVRIEGEVIGTGSGPSKQQAEKGAAWAGLAVVRARLAARGEQ